MPDHGRAKPAPHPHAAAEIPRLPRQHSGRDRVDGSTRRQRLHRGVGACPPGPRRSHRGALGRHQQHQCARYRQAGGRKKRGTPDSGRRAEAPARRSSSAAGGFSGSPEARIGKSARIRRTGGGRTGAEATARLAASALYHATSAILLAWEGSQPGVDARRALLARFVLEYRLTARDPLAPRKRRLGTRGYRYRP